MNVPSEIYLQRFKLRKVVESDAETLYRATSDPDTVKYIPWRPHRELSETQTLVAALIRRMASEQSGYYLLFSPAEEVLGLVSIKFEQECRAEIGFVIMPGQRQKGFATLTAKELSDWALQHESIYRVQALCDRDNTASIRVLERAGFQREAQLAKWSVHPNISNHPRDMYLYTKIKGIN